MRPSSLAFAAVLAVLAFAAPGEGGTIPGFPPADVASYTMKVRLDVKTGTISGTSRVRWVNRTATPASTLQWHMYMNAFRDRDSAYMTEARRDGTDSWEEERNRGAIEITSMRLPGGTDLLRRSRFVDVDGFPYDRTVLETSLPGSVPAGGSVLLDLAFTTKLPYPTERAGWVPGFWFAAQWFPKLGVWTDTGWNCHAYHWATEFFADFGTYDVTIDVPAKVVVAASGMRAGAPRQAGARWVYRFFENGIHDFAFAASPDFMQASERFERPGLPAVEMLLYLQPEHFHLAPRYFRAMRAQLEIWGRDLVPYPYPRISVVDPPRAAAEVDGMEYPTLITAGTELFDPAGRLDLEDLVMHELGHQWFYGIVATNEFEHPFLDEGITTWYTYRTLARVYPREPWNFRLFGFRVLVPRILQRNPEEYRQRFFGDPARDPISVPGWRTSTRTSTGLQAYSKPTLALATLERLIGAAAVERGIRLYVRRHAYRHPTPADFYAALEEGCRCDLDWFIGPVFHGTGVVDDTVARAVTKAEQPAAGEPKTYESVVEIRRLGSVSLPLEIELRFEDGSRRRTRWKESGRWLRIRTRSASALTAAIADPDRRLLLDVNRNNNAIVLTPDPRAARKWGTRALFWMQSWLLGWGAFA